jgi:hypothetical protein
MSASASPGTPNDPFPPETIMIRNLAVLVLLLLVSMALIAFSGPAGTSASPQEAEAPAEGEQLEDFVPSEEVPADSAVSFPVDI